MKSRLQAASSRPKKRSKTLFSLLPYSTIDNQTLQMKIAHFPHTSISPPFH